MVIFSGFLFYPLCVWRSLFEVPVEEGLLSRFCWKPSVGLSLKYPYPDPTDTIALGFELNFQLQSDTSSKCIVIKGQLQRFYRLMSYERAFKMLKNDMCITEIGQAVLEL